MPSINQLDFAELLGCILECIFYGMFVILATSSLYILVTGMSPTRRRIYTGLFVCTILLVALSTAHLSFDLHRASVVFFNLHTQEERNEYLLDVSKNAYTGRNTVFITMELIGDAVVVYRCWAIWRDWRIVFFPAVLAVTSAICGYIAMWYEAHTHADNMIYGPRALAFLHALFICSIVANGSATLLIAAKLWWIEKQANQYRKTESLTRRVMIIVIESGVLNAASLLILEISLVAKSNMFRVFGNATVPIIGITFSLVITRVGLQGTGHTSHNPSSAPPTVSFPTTPRMSAFASPRTPNFRDTSLSRSPYLDVPGSTLNSAVPFRTEFKLDDPPKRKRYSSSDSRDTKDEEMEMSEMV